MHIPDGYLSPSTCATLYAAASPFWYWSVRRLKRELDTRLIPLLSVFAAFSFVVMMFNLPLPGGTTGHAVGMGVAAIVLGPWAAILAISSALLIQSLFFGDGGVTAFGANCFNMAVAGSLTAYVAYRGLAFRSAIGSLRRVVSAGLAGYLAINVAALCAAIEFGIQPLFFHDASGAPLYAPYPLAVAIPAMMLGHLSFAGLAEFIITGGLVAYLQKSDPGLLRATAPDAPVLAAETTPSHRGLPTLRAFLFGLAALLIATPLGILAAGAAWGEWSARDYADPHMRAQIAAASGNRSAPLSAPAGLQRLSTIWTAPLPGYSPAFIRSSGFGYAVSAALGMGTLLLAGLALQRALPHRAVPFRPGRKRRRSFVEITIASIRGALAYALSAESSARLPGLLQGLDARVKLAGFAALLLATIAVHRLAALAGMLALAAILAMLSHVPVRALAARVWLPVLAFTGAIALPAVFLTPGRAVYVLPGLHWTISAQGWHTALLLLVRAEAAATLSVTLILCTLWAELLRALRLLRVPVILVVVLGMTYRYIFLFLQLANEMFEARQTRLVGSLNGAERRRLAAGTAGVLLSRSVQLSQDVHTAMRARGFRGEVYLLEERRFRPSDWIPLGAFAAAAGVFLYLGR